MGNAVVCAFHQSATAPPPQSVVKLIHSNGLVEEFHRPVAVGELSPDYPLHFFCDSNGLISVIAATTGNTDTIHRHSPAQSSSSSSSASSSSSSSSASSSSSSSPSFPSIALADAFEMRLGQIYFLLPRDFPLSQPSAITSLLSKSSIASRKESYKDIHVIAFSDYPEENSQDSPYAGPVSRDFVKQLLAETRLQLPSSMSGPSLVGPVEAVEEHCPKPSLSASSKRRLANPDAWQPLLDTILEEVSCN